MMLIPVFTILFLSSFQLVSAQVPILFDEYEKPYLAVNTTPGQSKWTPVPRMTLIIAQSQTLFAKSCLKFLPYVCTAPDCSEEPSQQASFDYPQFSATGHLVKTRLSLDPANLWSLQDKAYYATACKLTVDYIYGGDRIGVVGLGTTDLAAQNYLISKIFSFDFNVMFTKGQLNFHQNSSHLENKTLVATFKANSTWQTKFSGGNLKIGNYTIDLNGGSLMFDINSPNIRLPWKIFDAVVGSFSKVTGVGCTGGWAETICYYKGLLKNLPNITLSIAGNTINIPPEVYVRSPDAEKVAVMLNFAALDPTLVGNSNINYPYLGSIILGPIFMSYYHTVFDFSDGSNVIKIYKEGVEKEQTEGPSYFKFFVLGLIVVLCIVACVFFQKRRSKEIERISTGGYIDVRSR